MRAHRGETGIRRGIGCIDCPAGVENGGAKAFETALRRRVKNQQACRQRRYESVSSLCKRRVHAPAAGTERRNDQQPPLIDRLSPCGGDPHALDPAGGADDERWGSSKQQLEALLFHGRMKAADDGDAGIAQGAGDVVGKQDDLARAPFRAEQAQQGSGQDPEVPDRPQPLATPVPKRRGKFRTA